MCVYSLEALLLIFRQLYNLRRMFPPSVIYDDSQFFRDLFTVCTYVAPTAASAPGEYLVRVTDEHLGLESE